MQIAGAPRVITIVVKSGNHFDVHEGEGYADYLGWDEMLGCVAELTHPTIARGHARYFHSPEEHDAHQARGDALRSANEARRARVEAERASLPTLELRALHCYVELLGDRDSYGTQELLSPDKQPNADIQKAMRKLAAIKPTT